MKPRAREQDAPGGGTPLVRVATTAIVGGGLNLREGEVLSVDQLGEYAQRLFEDGAIEPVAPPDLAKFHLL